MFRSSHFSFWSLLAIFVYILQGKMDKMDKMEKTEKKITQLKWPKYQKTKMWDERNMWSSLGKTPISHLIRTKHVGN